MLEIKVYTTKNCPQCVALKSKLDKEGIAYTVLDTMEELDNALEGTGLTASDMRSAPVMVQGDMVWEGADCVLGVEEGEVC